MVKSIFELEKRTDLKTEAKRLETYLDASKYYIYNYSYIECTFWDLVDFHFEFWPYRYTATTAQEFFNLIELPKDSQNRNNEENLYFLQFIYDYIKWLEEVSTQYVSYSNDTTIGQIQISYKENRSKFKTILNNIEITAELLNYKIEKINDHFTFIKRDADVDSVLSVLENEKDIRFALLEYNDFRIENDIKQKRKILKQIGDYLEPKRKEFNTINKSLTDDIFFMLNKFYIRHNNNSNITFDSDADYIKWYDKLFKMIIHLIRAGYIIEIQNDLKECKK